MMMPAIGIRASPVRGLTPVRKMTANTGSTPSAIATAVQGQPERTPVRRQVVTTATTNISTTNSSDDHSRPMTATITSETAANCTVARSAATAWVLATPSRARHETTAATPTNTTSASASRQLGSTLTSPNLSAR